MYGLQSNERIVERRFHESRHNEVLDITNCILCLCNSKLYGKKPRYNETSLKRTHFPSRKALRYSEVALYFILDAHMHTYFESATTKATCKYVSTASFSLFPTGEVRGGGRGGGESTLRRSVSKNFSRNLKILLEIFDTKK